MGSSGDADRPAGEVPTDLDPFAHGSGHAGLVGRFYLVARRDEHCRLIELTEGHEVTIGRSEDSTIAVDDTRVSRNHARIRRSEGALMLEDLGSRNGTKLNGRVLYGEQRALCGGDVVDI